MKPLSRQLRPLCIFNTIGAFVCACMFAPDLQGHVFAGVFLGASIANLACLCFAPWEK